MSVATSLATLLLLSIYLPNGSLCFDLSRLTSFEDDGLGLECLLGLGVVLAILNYLSGRKINSKVANGFLRSVLPKLYEEFAVIGDQHHETVKRPIGETEVFIFLFLLGYFLFEGICESWMGCLFFFTYIKIKKNAEHC